MIDALIENDAKMLAGVEDCLTVCGDSVTGLREGPRHNEARWSRYRRRRARLIQVDRRVRVRIQNPHDDDWTPFRGILEGSAAWD